MEFRGVETAELALNPIKGQGYVDAARETVCPLQPACGHLQAISGVSKSKISFVIVVEQLWPLKNRFGLAAGAGVALTALRKCRSGQNLKRVAACLFNH